ncbi:hypothetical protein [Pseudomonas sp. RIT-PI-a]|uniref:hypothetical protein n=1 Tax=Pseudomonas sp. RIT-PI-a TaxID=1681194 RepID=UPI00128FA5EA|nr:hypothetical protein [Pseudomonas sp. RIT-PI-a]
MAHKTLYNHQASRLAGLPVPALKMPISPAMGLFSSLKIVGSMTFPVILPGVDVWFALLSGKGLSTELRGHLRG